ncbi:MAG: hypothetical protein Q3975_06955, partial [Oscillospiraceae bacterium]|nr:hypothetical protein [Oscillospiraceae bacterium]
DCKSVALRFGGSNPPSPTNKREYINMYSLLFYAEKKVDSKATVPSTARQKRHSVTFLRRAVSARFPT